jgi:DNA-binding LacI/PurR family transcriptional regulator
LIETYQGGRLAEVRSLRSNARYNGAIVFSTLPEDDRYLRQSGPLTVPLVLVQRSVEGHGWVNVDNHLVGARVADHLLDLGHERFGVVAADIPAPRWMTDGRIPGEVAGSGRGSWCPPPASPTGRSPSPVGQRRRSAW